MKLTRASKSGLVILTLGLATLLGVAIWLKTTREVLAEISMPMHAETVRREFVVDYDGPLYTMKIRFDGAVPETTARCLSGATKSDLHPNLDCGTIAPVLKFDWQLGRDGQTGVSGSSADQGSFSTSNGMAELNVVAFPARRNHQYEITLRFDSNASGLALPPPKVQIELDSFVKEDLFVIGGILDVVAIVLCLIGAGIFIVPFLITRVRSSKTSDQAS